MLSFVLIAALGHVTFAGCEGTRLDEALVRGLAATQAPADFEVRCTGADRVAISRLEHGLEVLVRELDLPPGSPAVRARTVAFVLGELAVGRLPVMSRAKGLPDGGLQSTGVPGTFAADATGRAGASQAGSAGSQALAGAGESSADVGAGRSALSTRRTAIRGADGGTLGLAATPSPALAAGAEASADAFPGRSGLGNGGAANRGADAGGLGPAATPLPALAASAESSADAVPGRSGLGTGGTANRGADAGGLGPAATPSPAFAASSESSADGVPGRSGLGTGGTANRGADARAGDPRKTAPPALIAAAEGGEDAGAGPAGMTTTRATVRGADGGAQAPPVRVSPALEAAAEPIAEGGPGQRAPGTAVERADAEAHRREGTASPPMEAAPERRTDAGAGRGLIAEATVIPAVDAGVRAAAGSPPTLETSTGPVPDAGTDRPARADTAGAGTRGPAGQTVEPAGSSAPPLLAANVRTTPVELAILPFFGLNQLFGTPARNYLAIGVLAETSTWLDGVAIAPVSYVEEEVRGVQIAGLVARTQHDLTGAQLSFGVSWTSGRVRGLQVGSTSFAGPLEGVQMGLLNIAGDVSGVQVGFINIARTVRGAQLGVFNVARSSDAPVGPFNFIDDTPWRFAFEVSESSLLTAQVKLGGRVMYSILEAGWTPWATFRLGGGLGAHLGHGRGWYLELEARALSLWDTRRVSSWSSQLAVGLRVNLGYQLADRVAIYAGTGAQLEFTPANVPGSQYSLFSFSLSPTMTLVPTAALGVQL